MSLKLVIENCQVVVDTSGFALCPPCRQPLPVGPASAGDLQRVLSKVLGSLAPSSHIFGLQFQVYLCPSLAARLLKKHSGALFPAEPSLLCQLFSCCQGHTLMYIVLLTEVLIFAWGCYQ